jgi:hypothetical protein
MSQNHSMTTIAAKYSTTAVLDSNIILEGLPLAQLPWHEVDSTGAVLVLLLPTLLKEVDSKKGNGRLGTLARAFNRLISPLTNSESCLQLVDEPIKVDLALAVCNRIDWNKYGDLDRAEGDEKLIAEILHIRDFPIENVIFISQDIRALALAKQYGITTKHVSETWLRQPEPSPQDKEIAKLKNRVAELSQGEPKFEIAFVLPNEPITTYQIEPLTEAQATQMREAIIERNPAKQQSRDSALFGQHDYGYDKRYEKYVDKTVPRFVAEFCSLMEVLYGQVPISITVTNCGNIRADRVVIDLLAIGGWFNSKLIAMPIGGPHAPLPKDPLELMSYQHNFPRTAREVGPHEFVVDRPRRRKEFSVVCEDFRHGSSWIFSGIVWVDPRADKTELVVKVTAANLHGTFTEKAVIQRTVVAAQVTKLVDISSGKVIVQPKILPEILQAMKSLRFEDYEFGFDSKVD